MANPTIDLTDTAVFAMGEFLFVRIIPQSDTSPSGLALPESDFEIGTVVSVGMEAAEQLSATDYQEGDEPVGSRVIFRKLSGIPINTPEPHKFLHYKEILAVLEPE